MTDDTAAHILALRLSTASLRSQVGKLVARVEALEKRAKPASTITAGDIAGSPILADAVAEVAAALQVSKRAILGRSRVAPVAAARQAVFLLAHDRGLSVAEISRRMRRDHTTVLEGIKAARRRIAKPEDGA